MQSVHRDRRAPSFEQVLRNSRENSKTEGNCMPTSRVLEIRGDGGREPLVRKTLARQILTRTGRSMCRRHSAAFSGTSSRSLFAAEARTTSPVAGWCRQPTVGDLQLPNRTNFPARTWNNRMWCSWFKCCIFPIKQIWGNLTNPLYLKSVL